MSVRRKKVISTDEIQFNPKPTEGVSQNGQTPNIIGICSYRVLDRPVFEWKQVLLHPELTPWSFLFADGVHHKKPHSPTHPNVYTGFQCYWLIDNKNNTLHFSWTCIFMLQHSVKHINCWGLGLQEEDLVFISEDIFCVYAMWIFLILRCLKWLFDFNQSHP